jgi:hypothetical protein
MQKLRRLSTAIARIFEEFIIKMYTVKCFSTLKNHYFFVFYCIAYFEVHSLEDFSWSVDYIFGTNDISVSLICLAFIIGASFARNH